MDEDSSGWKQIVHLGLRWVGIALISTPEGGVRSVTHIFHAEINRLLKTKGIDEYRLRPKSWREL